MKASAAAAESGTVLGCSLPPCILATSPSLAVVVMATWLDGHSHGDESSLGNQIEAALLGFCVIEIGPVIRNHFSSFEI
jgi:hydrogenase/urease accessory protein HupE